MSALQRRVGRVVQRHRVRRGLTQEALADAAGLHRTQPNRIERGRANVTLDTLERVTRVLGLSLGAFFSEVDAEPADEGLGDPTIEPPDAAMSDPAPGAGSTRAAARGARRGGRANALPDG